RVEAAVDCGEIDTGEDESAVCELEFELRHGDASGLFRLAKMIGDTIPLRLSVRTKADRGYALLRNDNDAFEKSEDVHLNPALGCEEAFRLIGRNCLKQLIANEPGMLRGDGEALHQMRIALRRLRAAISTFSDVVTDAECDRLKGELKWATG